MLRILGVKGGSSGLKYLLSATFKISRSSFNFVFGVARAV